MTAAVVWASQQEYLFITYFVTLKTGSGPGRWECLPRLFRDPFLIPIACLPLNGGTELPDHGHGRCRSVTLGGFLSALCLL